ncbi:DUF4129 domain-containing protein [Hymenobacter sp. B81]|uniref:DUF4129 domain-containing protein n=1 Tax=Hymenobacter sp. B81 TaxID=3344878 RepID=UPI0037DD95E6
MLALLLLAGPASARARPEQPALTAPTAQAAPAAAPRPGPVRRFDEARLGRLRADPSLRYRESPPPDNPLARWLKQLLERFFSRVFSPGAGIFWKVLFYALALASITTIVLHLLDLKPWELLRRRSQRLAVPFAVGEEDIHEETLPERLQAAEDEGQLRLATRLGYLLVLKSLADRELIAWQPDKTNDRYEAELRASAPDARPAFARLTRQFAYVWYGEFPLDAPQYARIRAERLAFLSALDHRRAA